VPNLYHIILLYSVEPCAPSCTSSLEPTCIDWHPLQHCLSCLRSRSFHSLGGCRSTHSSLSIFRRSACISPWSLLRVIRRFTHHRYNMHTAIPHLVTLPSLSRGLSATPLSVLSHPSSSCLTPQHTHPFTCNPYIVTIIDLHSKSALPSWRSAHH
jgi:hypothetical protein